MSCIYYESLHILDRTLSAFQHTKQFSVWCVFSNSKLVRKDRSYPSGANSALSGNDILEIVPESWIIRKAILGISGQHRGPYPPSARLCPRWNHLFYIVRILTFLSCCVGVMCSFCTEPSVSFVAMMLIRSCKLRCNEIVIAFLGLMSTLVVRGVLASVFFP